MKSVFPGMVLFKDRPEGWLPDLRELRKVRRVLKKKGGGKRVKKAPPPLTPEMAVKVALLPESLRKEMGYE